MNHGKEGVPHEAKSRCSYSHQYDNRVYTCKVSPLIFSLLSQLACWSYSPFGKTGLGPPLLHPKVFDIQIECPWNFSSALTKRTHSLCCWGSWGFCLSVCFGVFLSFFSPYSVEVVRKGHIHWLFVLKNRSALQEPVFRFWLVSPVCDRYSLQLSLGSKDGYTFNSWPFRALASLETWTFFWCANWGVCKPSAGMVCWEWGWTGMWRGHGAWCSEKKLAECSMFQACYERGKEVSVVPKTSASTDSPWMGLAKYAWSGWV